MNIAPQQSLDGPPAQPDSSRVGHPEARRRLPAEGSRVDRPSAVIRPRYQRAFLTPKTWGSPTSELF